MKANSSIKLNDSLVSLIGHVELTKAGWRDRLIEQIVVASLVVSDHPQSTIELKAFSTQHLGVDISDSEIQHAVANLRQRHTAILDADGLVKLTEQSRTECKAAIVNLTRDEAEIEAAFETAISTGNAANVENLNWPQFRERCLEPLIRELGAHTYEMLTGDTVKLDSTRSFAHFLETFQSEQQARIGRALITFMDGRNQALRAYILRHLHAHLLSLTAGLSARDLEELGKTLTKNLTIKIFVDTNFLFSLLGLHDNPANDSSAAILSVLKRQHPRLHCVLYVTPTTIEEARSALVSYQSQLQNALIGPKLGNATLAAGQTLSGIATKYMEAARKSEKRISAESYFEPYIRQLVTIARSNGIELFQEKLDKFEQDQAVIDDLCSQSDYESRRTTGRPKSYGALKHDIVLWHFASSKRAPSVDGPLDAIYWIGTVDNRFLAYDLMKRRSHPGSPAVCIHPAVLLQMIQFWVPKGDDFENAILSSFHSLMPLPFDSEAERVTISILGALSRFEAIDDLPTETLTSVLLNSALRERIGQAKDSDAQIELIKDELIAELTRAQSTATSSIAEKSKLEASLLQIQNDYTAALAEQEDRVKRLEERLGVSESAAESERHKKQELQHRIKHFEEQTKELDTRLQEAETRTLRREVRSRWRTTTIVTVLVASAITVLLFYLVPVMRSSWSTVRLCFSLVAVAVIALRLACRNVTTTKFLNDWKPALIAHRIADPTWKFMGALLFGLLGNLVWELLKGS